MEESGRHADWEEGDARDSRSRRLPRKVKRSSGVERRRFSETVGVEVSNSQRDGETKGEEGAPSKKGEYANKMEMRWKMEKMAKNDTTFSESQTEELHFIVGLMFSPPKRMKNGVANNSTNGILPCDFWFFVGVFIEKFKQTLYGEIHYKTMLTSQCQFNWGFYLVVISINI